VKLFATPTSFHPKKSLRQLTSSYHNPPRNHFPQILQLTSGVTISKTDPQMIGSSNARRLPLGPGCHRLLRSGFSYPSLLRLIQARPSSQLRVQLGPHLPRHQSLDPVDNHSD